MAENIDSKTGDKSDPAPAGHNGDALSDQEKMQAMRELANELGPIEEEMDKLRTKMKRARRNFKTATGISLDVFDAARKYANLEDDEKRVEKVTNFKLAYNALATGSQLDWVTAVHGGGKQK